jgi:hypothetical protein
VRTAMVSDDQTVDVVNVADRACHGENVDLQGMGDGDGLGVSAGRGCSTQPPPSFARPHE